MNKIMLYGKDLVSKSEVEVDFDFNQDKISLGAVHQVVKALLAKKRQGTSCTKNRAAVRGGGKKPFKQKGTGRARQGSTRAPIQVGGGTAFGPTPRDYTQKVNKKMMLRALESVLIDKFQSGRLIVVDSFEGLDKTKKLNELLDARKMLSSLLVTSMDNKESLRSANNLKRGKGLSYEGLNVLDIVKYEHLLIDEVSFKKVCERVSKL